MTTQAPNPLQMDARAFLDWWAAELATLLPRRVKVLAGVVRRDLVVTLEQGMLEATLVDGTQRESLGRYAHDANGQQAWGALFRARKELAECRVVLRLTQAQSLSRVLTLPRAVAENLKQTMGFELDRHTPFQQDQAYYAASILERRPGSGQITVLLAVTPRSVLDRLLRELASFGLTPTLVQAAHEQIGPGANRCNLLPEERRPRPRLRLRLLQTIPAVAVAVLVVGCFVLPVWWYLAARDALELQVNQQRRLAAKVLEYKNEAEALTQRAGFLVQRRLQGPFLIDVINELSRLLPDDTWLTNFTYRDHRLQIQGYAPAASQLIERIEASPRFQNTAFASPITRDRNLNLERFQITIQVNGATIDTPGAGANTLEEGDADSAQP